MTDEPVRDRQTIHSTESASHSGARPHTTLGRTMASELRCTWRTRLRPGRDSDPSSRNELRGAATHIGAAIAAQNVGALFAPLWGWIADRSRAYRGISFGGFVLLALGFLGFTLGHGMSAWLLSAFLVGFGRWCIQHCGVSVCRRIYAEVRVERAHQLAADLQRARIGRWDGGRGAAGTPDRHIAFGSPRHSGHHGRRLGSAGARRSLALPAAPFPWSRFGAHAASRWPQRPIGAGRPASPAPVRHRGAWCCNSSAFGTFLAGWFFFSLAISAFSSRLPSVDDQEFRDPSDDVVDADVGGDGD